LSAGVTWRLRFVNAFGDNDRQLVDVEADQVPSTLGEEPASMRLRLMVVECCSVPVQLIEESGVRVTLHTVHRVEQSSGLMRPDLLDGLGGEAVERLACPGLEGEANDESKRLLHGLVLELVGFSIADRPGGLAPSSFSLDT
jgi:hypothetical protein